MQLKRHLFVPRSTQPIKLSKRAEGELPKIEGYGAVFYREGKPETEYRLWDDYVERIMPGAFDEALRANADVRSLFNHDSNIVLGRSSSGTLELSVDEIGLFYSLTPPDTQGARDLIKSLEREDVDGSSFMFIPTETVWREQDDLFIREILSVELFECGPVTFPAYEGTTAGTREKLREMIESRKQSMIERRDQPKPHRGEQRNTEEPADCPGCRQMQGKLRALELRVKLLETS